MKHTPGFLAIVEEAKSRVTEVTAAEYEVLAGAGTAHVLIDVREGEQWAAGVRPELSIWAKGSSSGTLNPVPNPDALFVLLL